MLDFVTQIIVAWVFMALAMSILWTVQWIRRDAGIVDVGWAAGVGLLALFFAATAQAPMSRRIFVAVLAGLWSFRLAGYILVNRVLGKPEDGRYGALRQNWGRKAPLFFFLFFQAQGLLALLFALPMLIAMHAPRESLGVLDWTAAALWLVAIVGETLADWQLANFRADPSNRGRTCRAGLWRFSRHPNYFFEWLHWWTYVLIGIAAPHGWVTLLAPALMLYFLFKVTGIPATEAQAVASRGDDYRDYQRTTSPFVPWPPRASGSPGHTG